MAVAKVGIDPAVLKDVEPEIPPDTGAVAPGMAWLAVTFLIGAMLLAAVAITRRRARSVSGSG